MSLFWMKRIFIVALPVLVSLEAKAAVAYTQPPGGGLLQSSWWDPDGSDYDQYVWDDFTLGSNQAISEIAWQGGYDPNRFGSGGPVIDFTVAIHASIPAGIQPDVVSPALASYQTGGNSGETPSGAMYDYHFALPTPFQAAAGTKYWVQIEAAQHGIPDWGIATATSGTGKYFRRIANVGDIFYQSVSGDAAFTLLTAGGPTCSIATSASPMSGGSTSGDGAYPIGSNVMVTAAPSAGYAFVNWTENGAPVSTSASYSFTANVDRMLVANFVWACSIMTSASPMSGGSTSGDGTYLGGSSVTVLATPKAGYVFVDWTENGMQVSTSASYSFTAATDRLLVASFALGGRSVMFDFDTGTPTLLPGQSTPLDQASGGITAHFSSPTVGAGGFSIQSDASTHFSMSQFSGNYMYPNSIYNPAMDIQFSQLLTSITITFATADFQQVEVPTTIQLAAYVDSTGTPPVGSATAHGTYGSDTMPMGTLTFDSIQPFNLVEITIPYAPLAASDFLVDNIIVTTTSGLQRPGDINQDGRLDLGDAIRLLFHLFQGDPSALPCEGGSASAPGPGDLQLLDASGDGRIDITDVISALQFLFLEQLAPGLDTKCARMAGCPDRCGP